MTYSMLLGIQSLSIVLLMIETFYIFYRWNSKLQGYLFVNALSTLVNNVGYLLEMLGKNSESALFGTRFAYLGKTFIPLTFLVLVVEFCRIKLPKRLYYTLSVIHASIFLMVLTSDHHRLYYTGWYWTRSGLFPHNVFGHGVFYWLYMVLMLVYVIVGVTLLTRRLHREHQRDERRALIVMLMSVLVSASGIAAFLTGIAKGYDITALAYTISTILMLIAIVGFSLLNTMESADRLERVRTTQQLIITGMATMVESRDNSTGSHIKRTSDTVQLFTDYLQEVDAYPDRTPEFYSAVTRAAPMHDLGKIAVDDAVLRKPGRFTPEEFEQMKKHAAEGARIVHELLKDSPDLHFNSIAENVAHYHHERWDGTGYPRGLVGQQIPFESRIMALADVFDALVSKRCYKAEFTYDTAFGIIEESLGKHFDAELGRHFLLLRPRLEALYDGMKQQKI